MPHCSYDNDDYYDWEEDPLGMGAAEEEQRHIDNDGSNGDSSVNMDDLSDGADDDMEESDNKWADKDLMPEVESRNADSDNDERPPPNNNPILETVNQEEDDSVIDWNEMETSAGMTGTGSGADLLVPSWPNNPPLS
jgi:hypothetical protein